MTESETRRDTTKNAGTAAAAPVSPSHDHALQLGVPNYMRVAEAIRHAVIDGRFEDGQRLTTLELAKIYGLSLAPIREALNHLSAEGIVVLHPKRGAIVRSVSVDFLAEIYEIRLGLIPYLDGQRARIATPASVQHLLAIEEQYEAAANRGDISETVARNIELHRAMLAIRPNQEAVQILARHHGLLKALRHRYGFSAARPGQAIQEHQHLIDAFRRNDGEDAFKFSSVHLLNSHRELMALVKAGSISG
ncbi:GntR family transcriptional regulator [Bosea sp. (in: a-proteobacteria)]|uniref:GntR family transcriptional regulator n=1 Tax=Bosea sp. (in: a-proteobacteria) TaxID=1871050 RepID=UPI003F7152FC